jgi:hypothetical protein
MIQEVFTDTDVEIIVRKNRRWIDAVLTKQTSKILREKFN